MSKNAIDFYELLPTLYRLQDAEQGEPLRAVLDILAAQADIIKRDMDGLWDDFFIETAKEWIIPYIGELVGNNALHEIGHGRRADVAKTIYYRRRKGTLPMLEELARDITGWGAHTVNAFENLSWTQHVNHLRFDSAPNPNARHPNAISRVGTVNLRDMDGIDRLDTAFDSLSHFVDVRPAGRMNGRHNIRKTSFFLWRLQQFPITAPARRSGTFSDGFSFSVLGNPAPLFVNPEREAAESELATELHVAAPIRPTHFYFNLEDYYGADKSFAIYRGAATEENMILASEILCKDLSTWRHPPAGRTAVDVRLGRIAFAPGETPAKLSVYYNYGFSAKMGGGAYDRRLSLAKLDDSAAEFAVEKGTAIPTLQEAIRQWTDAGKPNAILRIMDNEVYGGPLLIEMPAGGRLAIVAKNGARPNIRPVGTWFIYAPADDAHVTLNGLLIEGRLTLCGDLKLLIEHCSLTPGRRLRDDGTPIHPDLDSIAATTILPTPEDPDRTPCADSSDLAVTLADSISGPIRMMANCEGLTAKRSVIIAPSVSGVSQPAIAGNDAGVQPAPPTSLEQCTIWGEVFVQSLESSDTIFNDRVQVVRLQEGCVRFSYLPPDSVTPRRYRCQPDLALTQSDKKDEIDIAGRLRPTYTSTHYGDPGFAQLGWRIPEEIFTGAENGAEMGAFNHLLQPQRLANLRLRLQEYLPFGLEAGVIFVT